MLRSIGTKYGIVLYHIGYGIVLGCFTIFIPICVVVLTNLKVDYILILNLLWLNSKQDPI